MKEKITGIVVWVCILLVMPMPASAITLEVLEVDGYHRLIGAYDVDVNGSLYDVRFVEGSFNEVFNPDGDQLWEGGLTFQTSLDAEGASQALLDQVLIDGAEGQFDSEPGLTYFNEFYSRWEPIEMVWYLNFLTPWHNDMSMPMPFINGVTAVNSVNEVGDRVSTNRRFDLYQDSYEFDFFPTVWADWSPAQPVPEPATILLFGIGIVGLAGSRIRRKKK